MTVETHNNLMRWAAATVIAAVFWIGLELMISPPFSVRRVIGATMVTALLLYGLDAKHERDGR